MPNTIHIAGRGSMVRQLRNENPQRQLTFTIGLKSPTCDFQKILIKQP